MDHAHAYAMRALPAADVPAFEAHLATCEQCQADLALLGDAFAAWPMDALRPQASVRDKLAQRIAAETGGEVIVPAPSAWVEPPWQDVAPGIAVKLLANDHATQRVSMLVRLAPGASYPAHTHAGVEELHLLDGELWIDERKLYPGDYNLGNPGGGDTRVFSETGCTCVLVTSTADVLL
jgi:anti-sigma factor ChrR (cupin superfamily)